MGKNRKYKAIRRLAAVLPKLNVMSETGIRPLDHAGNMKKIYKVHGTKGVQAYIQNVENHVNK